MSPKWIFDHTRSEGRKKSYLQDGIFLTWATSGSFRDIGDGSFGLRIIGTRDRALFGSRSLNPPLVSDAVFDAARLYRWRLVTAVNLAGASISIVEKGRSKNESG